MKTIQKYLAECDREKIATEFIRKYWLDSELWDERLRDTTLGELIDRYTALTNRLMNNIITAVPSEQEEKWVFFAAHAHDGFNTTDEILFYLAKVEDIKRGGDFETYAYDLCTFDEVVNYYVADTYLTQFYIDELIVHFLFEMSWYGVDQDELERVKSELLADVEESGFEADEELGSESMQEELDGEGLLEKRDPREEAASQTLEKTIDEYNEYCRNLEAEKIRELLAREQEIL